LPHAPYLVMMAVGDFSIVKDKWRDREVNYYVELEFAKYAKSIFGNTPEMIEFFSKRLGVDFAWPKYSQIVVRDYVSGAMENTSATLHGEFLQQTDRELLDHDNEVVISHELFHQWFGDLVTCESWSNLPLNESFATYGEYLWEEYKRGRDAADMHGYMNNSVYLRESRSGKDVNLIRFQYDDKEDMFDAHSYQKGGAVLHMLRKYVGDDAFFASLKYYLETNKFTPVEIHQLRLAFEHVTGEDLNWFFNQWFLNPGHPDLDIKYAYDETTKKETVTIAQTQDFTRFSLFRLPICVDIYSGGKAVRQLINVTRAKEDFVFDCNVKPDLVNVDAEKMLLCTKKDNHTPEEWIYMYDHAPLYLDRLEAMQALAKNSTASGAKETLQRALDDKFWRIRETAMRSLDGKMDNNPVIKQKFMDIAAKDEKAEVRTYAVEALIKNFPKDESLMPLYINGLKDQSYGMIGQCLNGILKQNPTMGLQQAKPFRQETSTYILSPLCSIYASYGSDDDLAFFQQIASRYRSWGQTAFLGNLGTFLKDRCKDETVVKGIPLLVDMTRNASNKYVKYYGFSALNSLLNHYQDLQDKTQHKIDEMKAVANAPASDSKSGNSGHRSKTTEPVVSEDDKAKAQASEKVMEDQLAGYKEMTRIINDGIANVKKHDEGE
jgi:aminopeptidase N